MSDMTPQTDSGSAPKQRRWLGPAFLASAALKQELDASVQAKEKNALAMSPNSMKSILAEAAEANKAKRTRVKFNSDDYFVLLAKEPRCSRWLALGQNVQFVLNGTIYEIHE